MYKELIKRVWYLYQCTKPGLCLQDPYILIEPTKYAHLQRWLMTKKDNYKWKIVNSLTMATIGNSDEGRSWKKEENLGFEFGVLGRDF